MNEKSIAQITVMLSFITTILFAVLAFQTKNQSWFRVAAGSIAIFTIICLWKNYFNPPKRGEMIRAPNAFVLRCGGVQAIWSSTLLIIGAWPDIF
jgi:phosphoglycerol transferase MdoB-like AlkP superfamily enzyme